MMPLGGGSNQGKRLSKINWTCDKNCWCHIPVRGQTQPPCYQCVLAHCSLSYKENFAPSAPEHPCEDDSNDQTTSEAQVSGAAGGLGSSTSFFVASGRNEFPAAVSTPLSSPQFINTDENTLGAIALSTSTVESVRTRRGTLHGSITSPLHPKYAKSSQLDILDPLGSDLEQRDFMIDQIHMFSDSAGHAEIPEQKTLSNDAQKDDESSISEMADSEEAEYTPTPEREPMASMSDAQINRSSWITDTEENITPLENPQDPEDSGDLSSRLRMLILDSEEQELLDSQKKEVACPRTPTNWTVNSKGLTVCICGNAHRCYSRRRPPNYVVKRRNHQSFQLPHRPRFSTSSEARNRSSHPFGLLTTQQPHKQRFSISGEARKRSFHPLSHLTQREIEFRRINKIHRRESATDAAKRYGAMPGCEEQRFHSVSDDDTVYQSWYGAI